MRLRPELADLRAVAFDLDGVLYHEDRLIPGADRTVAVLRAAGTPIRFVTNTTSLSRRLIRERLTRFGIEAHDHEILCPSVAAARFLARERLRAALFVPDAALEDFAGVMRDDVQPDAVVIGDLDAAWTFERLNEAFRLLLGRQTRLVALGRTRYWHAPGGLQLDVGAFIAALEYAAGTHAIVFGKPDRAFFEALLDGLALPPHVVCMIGDDIVSDVGAALDAGMRAVLVKTGKFRPADLDRPITPTLVLDSVADLLLP